VQYSFGEEFLQTLEPGVDNTFEKFPPESYATMHWGYEDLDQTCHIKTAGVFDILDGNIGFRGVVANNDVIEHTIRWRFVYLQVSVPS